MWLVILTFSLVKSFMVLTQPYHHSTVGEYFVDWKEIGPCPPDKRGTNEIFTDVHLTRRHRKPEVVGNLSFEVPFDDTTPMKVNFAVLGSNSGWLPNAYTMMFPNGCSGLISILQEGWTGYMKSFNMSPKCPMQKGFYRTSGYDADNFLKNPLIPKQFIYGRYKITLETFSHKKNELIGCTYFTVDVLPKWQKKKREKND